MWQLRFVGWGLSAEFWMNGFSFVELEKLFCMNRGDWGCDLNEWRRSRCCLLLVLLHGRKNIWKLERDGYVYVPIFKSFNLASQRQSPGGSYFLALNFLSLQFCLFVICFHFNRYISRPLFFDKFIPFMYIYVYLYIDCIQFFRRT